MLQLPPSGQPHYAIGFSQDGRWLAGGGLAAAVDLWDLRAPAQPARRVGPFQGAVLMVQFTPLGQLWVGCTEEVIALDPTAGAVWVREALPLTRRAACSPDGNSLAIASGFGMDRWHLRGGALTQERQFTTAGLTDVAFAANSRVVLTRATSDEGGLIVVLTGDAKSGVRTPVTGRPHRVACSADGELAATLALGNLSVWNLSARTAVVDRYADTHGGWLSVAFAPHGRRIVTGGLDGTVAVWDATSPGPPVRTFQWGVGPVYAVAFDRNGQCAAAAGHAGALVWDVDD